MTVLVVGSTGQLAQSLRPLLPEATFWSRADADLTQPEELQRKVLAHAPSCIINAAAYTAVDKAESEPAVAWRVNADSPAALARAAAELDAPLVHVSTDYVFDGSSERPYLETDPVSPLSVYGTTKLAGELAIRTIWPRHWILRTSWVFSEHGTNFVKTMLRLAKDRDELRVVGDQHGRPSCAGDLAQLIVALVESGTAVSFGTHHATGGAATNWHAFATRIIGRAHELGMVPRLPTIVAIPASAYPTPARRPMNSVMQPSPALVRLANLDWEAGLERTLTKLK